MLTKALLIVFPLLQPAPPLLPNFAGGARVFRTLDRVERLIGQEGATEPGRGASPVGQGAVSLPRVPGWRKKSCSDPVSQAAAAPRRKRVKAYRVIR
jgi:hypothetical protein